MAASTTIVRGNVARTVLAAAILLSLSGCASMARRAYQSVAFDSDPEGALVRIDGIESGYTPVVVRVQRRGGPKIVTYELPGFKTHIMKLDRRYNGWALGNIILGPIGIVGSSLDAISGRKYDFDTMMQVRMEPGTGVAITIKEQQEPASPPILADADPSFKDDF
jgi:PEGA domain-containing protein